MKTIAAVLVLSTMLFAQTPVKNVSVGSPLLFEPTVTADIYWPRNVNAKNVSSKEVLAFDIVFNGSFGASRDFYMGDEGFMPESTEVVTEIAEDQTLPPTLQARVLWVQFADGTEWGDHTAGIGVLMNRKAYRDFMAQVVNTYSTGGDALALITSTKQNDQANPMVIAMATHFLDLSKSGKWAMVIQHIQGKLANAAKHDKQLNP